MLYVEREYLRSKFVQPAIETPLELPSAAEIDREDRFSKVRDFLGQTSDTTGRHLVLANNYPALGNEYANGFVHRRVKTYLELGAEVDVMLFRRGRPQGVYEFDGVRVLEGYTQQLLGLLASRTYQSVSAHFLNAHMWQALYPARSQMKLFVFIHGNEADRWIRRKFDVHSKELLDTLIRGTFFTQHFWQRVVSDRELTPHFICVSNWWRRAVAEDMEIDLSRSRTSIIHNVVDTALFAYQPKTADHRFKILWVRNMESLKYGPDLAIAALKHLRTSRWWSKCEVRVIGDGKYFSDWEEAFGDDPVVTLERRFLTQTELARTYNDYGIALVPTRYDAQGVSRDEAMSCGLVPVTNRVAAVDEFVDDSCALLGSAEAGTQLGVAIAELMADPDRFLAMSAAAAARVRRQVSPEHTVMKEAELLGMVHKANDD